MEGHKTISNKTYLYYAMLWANAKGILALELVAMRLNEFNEFKGDLFSHYMVYMSSSSPSLLHSQ